MFTALLLSVLAAGSPVVGTRVVQTGRPRYPALDQQRPPILPK